MAEGVNHVDHEDCQADGVFAGGISSIASCVAEGVTSVARFAARS